MIASRSCDVTALVRLNPEEQLDRMRGLAHAALPLWNIESAALDLLKYRENAVFKVTAGDSKFAMRVHRPGYHTDDALRSELQWMDALSHAGIDVPRIVPTASGELFATSETVDMPAPLQIDLFEWIDGRQLGSVEAGVSGTEQSIHDLYFRIGELAALLHNQAQAWTPPADFVRHAWDEHGLAGKDPFWGRFWELSALTREQRRLLAATRERVHRELGSLPKTPTEYGLIHADFSPENMLVEGSRVRLIDFDDAGYGWHLFELATPLFFLMDEAYFDTANEALLDGYRSRRALSDEQLERLPLFLLARGLTYVGWVHTRPETETARELTGMLVDMCCRLAHDYMGTSTR
jgi:Ser/Thr protein kinase RdoA (MazF antagonist)